MSVSPDDIRHVAALARVVVPDARIPALADELRRILAHMDVLQSVDISLVRAVEVAGMPLRSDSSTPIPLERTRDQIAPDFRDGFFVVPRLDSHGHVGSASAEEDQ